MTHLSHRGLNISAGQTYIPNLINISNSPFAELKLDLGKESIPLDDNSADVVFSYHALEHISNYLFALSEIHRVLKHGGIFLVGLPYITLTKYHLVNPYHLHNFNEFSFDFFDPRKNINADESNRVFFHKIFHRFHYLGMFKFTPSPLRTWCRNHLLNVVQKIDYGLIAIKDKSDIPTTLLPTQKSLLVKFDDYLNASTPYQL